VKRFIRLLPVISVCVLALCLLSCVSTREESESGIPFLINEICSGNSGHYIVAGDSPDYIELHNLTGRTITLDGYFVSDDEDHLDKFSLAGYSIPGKGYLVLAADKKELPFKLSSSGEELFLSDADGNILQHVELPEIEKDTTFSLQPDGTWHITDPTPKASNLEGVPYVKVVYVASPRFSHEAGFYDEPFDLELEGYRTYRIYYTMDGKVPDENSTLYTGAIHIDDATSHPNTLSMRTDITIDGATPPDVSVKKATIISAVAIDEDGNRSNVVTNAYFVGFREYRSYLDIPVVSIVADPSDLFDELDGIYVRGRIYQEWLAAKGNNANGIANRDIPTNYRQKGIEWEIPVSIQEFDRDGSVLFSQNAGLRIHGSSTRERVQKSFNIYARSEYGDKDFRYAMVPGTEHREKYVIRINAGIDSIVHDLLEDLGLPVSKAQPCLCFLNGEFWGFYELREKQDEEYIADVCGVDEDDLIVVKNQNVGAGEALAQSLGYNVESRGLIKELNAFFSQLDTSTPEGYEAAQKVIDVDNYLVYVVANFFFNNGDFLNNDTLWRTASVGDGEYNDGRWRWIIQDMDQCFFPVRYKNTLAMLVEKPVFASLWNSESFRTRFYTLAMDFANVLFSVESVKNEISERLDYYYGYFRISEERFMESDPSSYNYWKTLKSTIISFLTNRRNELISQCEASLTDRRTTHSIAVNGMLSETKLLVNGYSAYHEDSLWEGIYFSGCEITLEVKEIPGYRFCGWYEDGALLSDQKTVTVSTDKDQSLTPVYEAIPVVAVMDRINFARSNFRGGYELYNLNTKSGCVLVPDAGLESSVNFTAISFSSDGEWQEGTGFTISFPTNKLSSCGMILWFTISEGCPEKWNLFYIREDGKKVWIDCDSEPTDDGLMVFFELPVGYTGLPEVELHMESAEDCAGGTVKITEISLYGYGI